MSAYRKFSDSFRRNVPSRVSPAKAAKPAKANLVEVGTLAELAALACGTVEIDISAACAEPTPAAGNAATAWNDAEEERTAIVKHEGGIPRAWAEGFALLDPNRPPANVPLRRWRAIIDAIGAFLDQWAVKAAAMGWEAADIFGADAVRPEISWLNAGPLWAGNGARVVEVHPDHIVFETRGGARQTHYRRPQLRLRALPWELGSDHGG